MTSELPELPIPVTTIGPCMFGGEPSVETPLYTADQMREYAKAALLQRAEAAEAERDALLYELADLHDSIRTAYKQCPQLPVRVETMDWATDALHDLCLIVGIHGVSVPPPGSPIHDAAIDAAQGGNK